MIALECWSPGASHKRVGKECQDYSWSTKTDEYAIAITCDGHGADNYFRSAKGSNLAADAAAGCITELLEGIRRGYRPADPEAMLVQLEKSIIARWNEEVREDYEKRPFTQEELAAVSDSRRERLKSGRSIETAYGTTLIALTVTKHFWFGIQIGDGKCVRIKSDGSFDMPIPVNDKCFLNTTTSLCGANAIEDFRHCYFEDLPAAIFCGTDGVDDSFTKDEQLYKLYATIARSFASSDYAQAKSELEEYLPRLSDKGSEDDVSIAGIIDEQSVLDALGEEQDSSSGEDASNGPAIWVCGRCGSENTTKYCGECGSPGPMVVSDAPSVPCCSGDATEEPDVQDDAVAGGESDEGRLSAESAVTPKDQASEQSEGQASQAKASIGSHDEDEPEGMPARDETLQSEGLNPEDASKESDDEK